MTLGTLLPIVLLFGLAAWLLIDHERSTFERGARERVRALSTALDARLQSSVEVLQSMAESTHLERDDLPGFEARMRRLLARRPDWITVNLALPSGQQVMNLRQAAGEALPKVIEPESFEAVLRSAQPVIGDMALGADRYAFAVRVPVLRGAEVRYVLSAVVAPASVGRLLEDQHLPSDWIGVIVDRNRRFVARTYLSESTVGQPASKTLTDAFARPEPEAYFYGRTREGIGMYTASFRSAYSGWGVAIGVPEAAVEASGLRLAATLAVGMLLALALAVGVATREGRRLAAPMAALAQHARALASGQPIDEAVMKVSDARSVPNEIAVVGRTLALAGAAEAERRELLQRAKQARHEAESANRAKDEFLAMLGHELRNPLAAISNAAHLLDHAARDTEPPAAATLGGTARGVIRRQLTHLTRLVDDLLDVSRVTRGKIELSRAPLDLAEAAQRVVAALGIAARHRLVLDVQPAWIDGDATRLEQVLSNLLTNAARYTPEGHRIELRLRRAGSEAVLTVSDEGMGIEPALLPRVFDLFVQGKPDSARSLGGLGIGLTLVRRLVELHGGQVEAHSDGPGRGSVFTVRLPAIEPPPVDAGVATAAAGETASPVLRVLLVEDNDDARAMLHEALSLRGHVVLARRDGPGGIAAALSWRPDVALIDIGLPGLDGHEVARRIRAAEGTSPMLLVALSGYGLPIDHARSAAAGFDLHAVKPLDADQLLALVHAQRIHPHRAGAAPAAAEAAGRATAA